MNEPRSSGLARPVGERIVAVELRLERDVVDGEFAAHDQFLDERAAVVGRSRVGAAYGQRHVDRRDMPKVEIGAEERRLPRRRFVSAFGISVEDIGAKGIEPAPGFIFAAPEAADRGRGPVQLEFGQSCRRVRDVDVTFEAELAGR